MSRSLLLLACLAAMLLAFASLASVHASASADSAPAVVLTEDAASTDAVATDAATINTPPSEPTETAPAASTDAPAATDAAGTPAATEGAAPAAEDPNPGQSILDEVARLGREARAAISQEELERQLRENTIVNADLLPTIPAPKEYAPTGKPEFALLITPGKGRGCTIKKYPGLQQFLAEEAWYYPALHVEYALAGDPKVKFYADKSLRDEAMIHGAELSEEDIMAILLRGPQPEKEPLLNVELKDNKEITSEELKELMRAHGLERSAEADQEHSSRLVFHPDFVPVDE